MKSNKQKVLITGCAGFIGCHLAKRFLNAGFTVVGLDNLGRRGNRDNLAWLKAAGSKRFTFHRADITDAGAMENIVRKQGPFDLVLHEAAQVAVTLSVTDPRADFEANALGTLNVLEAVRKHSPGAAVIFASTNKVYGKMDTVPVCERNGRYEYRRAVHGISETAPLDFYSPYGCSKGAADQYVRDYARIYGLRTVVFRQSCIYGTRQFGMEDQGWVAWFTIASLMKRPLTIYGDGKQGRDILWIDDLTAAYELAFRHIDKTSGQIYNMGGGSANLLSLLELVEMLKEEKVLTSEPRFGDWRPGDQKVFVSDSRKFSEVTGWRPETDARTGVRALITWVRENQALLKRVLK